MISRSNSTFGWPFLGLVLALVLASQIVRADGPESVPLVFAAGSARGNYSALASAIAAKTEGSQRTIRVRQTTGSYENAGLLRDGEADLALLQSDVAYMEHYNGRPFVALASVYTEPIHVIAYRGLDLHRLSEVISLLEERSLTVAVGAPGSGSSAHAFALLDELGLAPERISKLPLSLGTAASGLRDRSIDLAFLTSAVPATVIKELADDRIISLLDIDRDIAQLLRRKNPFFVVAEIPFEAYGVSKRNVQTLGTRTLLVARPDLDGDAIWQVLDALDLVAVAAPAEGPLSMLRDLSPSTALRGLPIPVHPAAQQYYTERTSLVRRCFDALRRNAALIFVLGTLVLASSRLSPLAYFVHQFVLGRVLLALVMVWLLGSVSMHLIEGSKNSAFRSFGSSAVAILHYLFSGLESSYPVTPAGHGIAILVLSLGVAVATLFTATLVTLLVEQALNIKTLRRKPIPFLKLSGHVVLAGWSSRTRRIIQQLRNPELRFKPAVVVIAPEATKTTVRSRRGFRGVWVVEGDRTQASTLLEADITTASHAIVLTDSSADNGEDLSTICSSMAIRRLAPEIHTVVEVRASTGAERLLRDRTREVVDTETLAERLVSQCVITPGIAQVFDELLSFGANSQEIYILPLERHLDGSSFAELRVRLRTYELILLGYWLSGERSPRLNPDRRAASIPLKFISGQQGDSLLVLADSPRALNSRLARLKQWRTSMSKTTPLATLESPAATATQDRAVESGDGPTQRASRIGICGWNDQARAVISQLQESVIASHQEFEITVIDGPTGGGGKHECSSGVRFVFGDPTRSAVLENAGVNDMETLVVLADRGGAESERFSDHRSLVICLSARDVKPDLHLVVEVLQSANQEHFERLAGVEVVSVEDLAEKLLAQAVISVGITSVFLELLTATEDSNEVYVVPVPERWRGKTFSHIAVEVEESELAVVVLGYRAMPAEGRPVIVLNPRHRKTERGGVVDWRQQPLVSEDALVVMAFEEPDW